MPSMFIAFASVHLFPVYIYQSIDLSDKSSGTFLRELVPFDFSLVVLRIKSIILSTCGACLEIVFEFR